MLSMSRGLSLGACAGVLAGASLIVWGCDRGREASPRPTGTADATAAQTVPDQAEPRRPGPLPRDIDVDALTKKIGCGRAAKVKDACRVLQEFAQAGRWVWPVESPEARWAGNAYVVSKGDEDRKAMVLYGKQVPTMQVDPDMLPLKLGAGILSEQLGAARWSLVDGISRLSRVAKKNPARVAASSFTPKTERWVQATEGASVLWVADDKAYFRQQGRKVLVVELSADATDQHGEGTYAELWPVYW
jgi:hypothetical protein